MEEGRKIIFDPLRHGTILRRMRFEFWVFCALREQNNEDVLHCKPIFQKVCMGEPITMKQLQELLDAMDHPLLRPLKVKLAELG